MFTTLKKTLTYSLFQNISSFLCSNTLHPHPKKNVRENHFQNFLLFFPFACFQSLFYPSNQSVNKTQTLLWIFFTCKFQWIFFFLNCSSKWPQNQAAKANQTKLNQRRRTRKKRRKVKRKQPFLKRCFWIQIPFSLFLLIWFLLLVVVVSVVPSVLDITVITPYESQVILKVLLLLIFFF